MNTAVAKPLSPLAEAEIAAAEHEADHSGGYDSNCPRCEDLQQAIEDAYEATIPGCTFCGGKGHTATAHDQSEVW